ncbi:MAG: HAMP domain-containing histidine kinase, partial [Magnetococcales bacterium]|nr:HAMP domain-containing histidine kinase [Magnetococcales bacterium]
DGFESQQRWVTLDNAPLRVPMKLTAELDDYFARRERNPHSLPPKTITIHGYIQEKNTAPEEIPDYLRSLTTGRHSLTVGTLYYRVAVVERKEARYFFLYDTTLQEKREQRFTILLGASILIIILISALGGVWMVGIIIAPVTELATRVKTRQPDVWSLQLADDFFQDEVGELAHAFDLHLARIRAFMERERAFTADLSHELRTSLAVILSAAEILLSDDSLTEKQINRVRRIDRAARDMSEMGTALLLMSREEHSLSIEESTCVADVIEEAVEKHRFLLKNKPIHLTHQTDPALLIPADRGLVFIAIANLIRNAFAYTEQGEIAILQDHASLTIRDSGCGLRDPSETLFLRHFRAAPSHEGSGIGLSLVKRICDRYGWKIKLTSQGGNGTTVHIIFFQN